MGGSNDWSRCKCNSLGDLPQVAQVLYGLLILLILCLCALLLIGGVVWHLKEVRRVEAVALADQDVRGRGPGSPRARRPHRGEE